MRTFTVLFVALFFLSIASHAQKKQPFNPAETISADSARRNLTEIVDELKKKHPGFYRYNTEALFNKYFDSVLLSINTPQNQLSYFRKVKPVIAQIRCLHTGVSLSDEYLKYLNNGNNLLPLQLYFVNDKAFITANYSGNTAVPVGAEVIAINQKPIKGIMQILFAAIPSDGYNETLKYQLLNHQFAQWYRSVYEVTDKFTLTIKTADGQKDLVLNGIKNKDMPAPAIMDLGNKPRLSFLLTDTLAMLTIQSFGNTDIKAGGQNFKKFINNVFDQLNLNPKKKLIIDLRNNTGGTDANAAYLCSLLMNKPYRYWDRIEVTEPFALSIKGAAKLMYGKPVKQDSVYIWKKSKFTNEFDFYEPQLPQKNAFTGKVFILINGLCMSSCADLAAVLQYNKRATFIGEETGGGYQGNNSGLIPEAPLAFGIKVTVPLLKYINAVDANINIGHGTYPDVAYKWDVKAIINHEDPEITFAVKYAAEH